jgi:hypothetical protein
LAAQQQQPQQWAAAADAGKELTEFKDKLTVSDSARRVPSYRDLWSTAGSNQENHFAGGFTFESMPMTRLQSSQLLAKTVS